MSLFESTLRSRGYYMTDADVRTKENAAIANHTRAKWALSIASGRLSDLASDMLAVLTTINTTSPEDLATFQFHPASWLNPDEIHKRAQDVVNAKEEIEKTRIAAAAIGISVQ
jgi:hypothetical protein